MWSSRGRGSVEGRLRIRVLGEGLLGRRWGGPGKESGEEGAQGPGRVWPRESQGSWGVSGKGGSSTRGRACSEEGGLREGFQGGGAGELQQLSFSMFEGLQLEGFKF